VYVVGYETNTNIKNVSKIWKNGVEQSLTDGTFESEACSVYVLGRNVYVAGYERNTEGIYVAKVWKNGATKRLIPFLY